MSGLDLNFGGGTKASSGGFPAIPEGTYNARIDNVEIKDTQPKEGVEQKASDGTPARYLNTTYKILDGEYEGRLLWGINSIRFPSDPLDDTDKERTTREMFLSWLNTVTGTDFTDTEMKLDLKDLVGAKVRIVVTQREWQGDVRNNVKKVLSYEDNNSALENARRSL